jgi:hypothetical protein
MSIQLGHQGKAKKKVKKKVKKLDSKLSLSLSPGPSGSYHAIGYGAFVEITIAVFHCGFPRHLVVVPLSIVLAEIRRVVQVAGRRHNVVLADLHIQ